MKKIAFWNNYTIFANNQAFNPNAYGIGEDLGYSYILLKNKLYERGFILETLDLDSVENYDYVIFIDVPDLATCCKDVNLIPKEKKILILTECEMIYAPNRRQDLLNYYSKVFSYNDDLVNNFGYHKLNLPNKIKIPLYKNFSEKKFSTLIAGNKVSYEKGELYSERIKTIKYMERYHLNDFDLFGFGWDQKIFKGNKFIRLFNRFNFLKNLFGNYKSYKGKVNKKLQTLSNYKFCFCYENSNAIPGYISEKIMDCFFAGTIPIYYGAPNVTDYIPENCFIDYRDFNNLDDLYKFLINISEEEYNTYLANVKSFLVSSQGYLFSAECFVDTIIKEIL